MKRILTLFLMQAVALSALHAQDDSKAPKHPERSAISRFKNQSFTTKEIHQFRANYNLPTLLSGGDASVWMNMSASESLHTAILPAQQASTDFPRAINSKIGDIKAETKHFGTLTLDEFMNHPQSYAQGFLVVHKGTVVYENYPGIKPLDHHLWMSCAKTTVGLVIELLIEDGKIDDSKTLGFYVPEFRGSAWEDVEILDVLDMTPGLNSEENDATRSDPNSIASRAFKAEFNIKHEGKHESLLEVLKMAQRENPAGEKFEYGSPTTQALVYLAEAVTGQPWADFFDDRVWSKIRARGPLQIHLSPNGIALGHGLVSSSLHDMACFGMLFTPSWNKVASEQVVTPKILQRIRDGVRSREFFRNGYDGQVFEQRLNDKTMISNSRQWDAVWPDGDIWKSGLQSQALYVSPSRDLVIVFFSVNAPDDSLHRYLRPIATSLE